MKKLLKSKWFIALIVLLVLAAGAILSLLPGSPVKKLLKPVQLVSTPAQSIVKSAGDTITDFWAAITDGIAIREENRALWSHTDSLTPPTLTVLRAEVYNNTCNNT